MLCLFPLLSKNGVSNNEQDHYGKQLLIFNHFIHTSTDVQVIIYLLKNSLIILEENTKEMNV